MLPKFAALRSRGSSGEKGKQFKRFDSEQNQTRREFASSNSEGSHFHSKSSLSDTAYQQGSHFSSKSLLSDRSSYQSSPVSPIFYNSPAATRASDERSSQSSFGKYSSYDGSETPTASSSTLSEDIDIGPPSLLSYEDAEEQFLEEHEGYFLHLTVNNVRKAEYPKLDLQRIIYLDYASSPLYSRFQVEQHMRFLLEETDAFLGSNYTSEASNPQQDKYINSTSQYILDLLNTTQNDYSVIFTPCLSASYHLFSEIYHFQRGAVLLTSRDNRRAIRHVVNSAIQSNVKAGAVPLRNKDLLIHEQEMHKIIRKQGQNGQRCGLLTYPAQSSLSGICYPLSWIVGAQQHNWEVLLDVSSCLPMVRVDLSLYQPEFVIGSTHHILGYPSGVGFLLVRKSAYSVSPEKGSVQLKSARTSDDRTSVHVVNEGENMNTHIFAALSFGFEHLESVGIEAVQKRVESLISWLVKSLKSLKHKSGEKPLLQLYGSTDRKYRGSILAFNVLDPTGNMLPARLVQKLAARNNIFLGAGTLADPNLYSILHQKPEKRSDSTNLDSSGRNLEAVRLSLGPISAFEDAYRLAQFLCRFRDEEYMAFEAADYVEELKNSS